MFSFGTLNKDNSLNTNNTYMAIYYNLLLLTLNLLHVLLNVLLNMYLMLHNVHIGTAFRTT